MTIKRILTLFALLTVLASSLAVVTPAAAQGNSGAAHACQKGGWQELARGESNWIPFVNQGECVRHAAQGGTVVGVIPSLVITVGEFTVDRCRVTWTFSNGPAGTTVLVTTSFNNGRYRWQFVEDGVAEGDIDPRSYITGVSAIDTATGEAIPLHATYPTHVCGTGQPPAST